MIKSNDKKKKKTLKIENYRKIIKRRKMHEKKIKIKKEKKENEKSF